MVANNGKVSGLPNTTVTADRHSNATRVFYWTPVGDIEHGTIVGSNKLLDGTVIVALRAHSTGEILMMPMAAVNIDSRSQ
ncbi:hypothetical protein BJ165DRAFT_1535403 [Panaeolus papilionaceus]|nr:hypothetical protein BJ165DRAFT_1535403 [Panaeolus papilionaceus]